MSDYKREHKNNVKFCIEKVAVSLLRDAAFCAVVIAIGNSLFDNEIITALHEPNVQRVLIAISTIVVLYEIKYGRKLCFALDNMDVLRELEYSANEKSLLTCARLIRNFEKQVEIYKQKIDIMKSLSPIPLTVLIIGFLIDKNKSTDLLWNYYTILLIVVCLFYAIELYRSFDKYKTSQFQLNDVQNCRDEINFQLEGKK
ncbi:hypothetical protein [Faecalispora jeddahensis]|uniref:hypothetical protein n=1 Tax=Faecalispora jeddahensis TaxID=1414721 RepID=UPI0005A975A8|nr:hypothetical protein [Faecalispora jeddahensis]